jgi:diguanylate cyclase (GGDEF)-like protein
MTVFKFNAPNATLPVQDCRNRCMFERLQNAILTMIAVGRPLEAVAARICSEAELLAPLAICSVLRVDCDGRLHPLAAPSLPFTFSGALEGLKIGPSVGSCGTAAYRKEPVSVVDIAADPLWAPYRALADSVGVKACWSSPIIGNNGTVLGTFAFYYRTTRGPTALETDIVEAFIHLCSIALERELARTEIHRLAYFDMLTGLPNRASFERAIEGTSNAPLSLLLIDIDRLKHVNDTFGHMAGDDLIRDLGQRIGASAGPGVAYRIGGDEFAVIVEGDAVMQTAAIAMQILASMVPPALCAGHALAASVTIGGVAASKVQRTPTTCRLHADLALYHAKAHDRGGLVMYSDHLGTAMARRNRTVFDVSEALCDDRIEAHYQPIVRLDTREVVGLEALCRVRLRDGSVLAAGDFFEAFEDVSIGAQITERMIAQVAGDVRSWLDQGIPFQHVGLNVSTADFQRSDLHDRIVAAFEKQKVPLKHLILEVTESVYMGESDHMVGRTVRALRAKGLLVALDDFGTGYASLTHLLRFPVDVIKIDQSFVGHLGAGGTGTAIVKGLIEIAAQLGMRIVAEGVERYDQAEQLRKLGCTLGQGYLFGCAADSRATTETLLRFAQEDPTQPRLVRVTG